MPELITAVPTHFPSAGNNRQTFERVPDLYAPAAESTGELHGNLLQSLSSELNWANKEQVGPLAEHAYSIARQIGDTEIGDRSARALSLIDATRSEARFNTVFTGSEHGGHVTHRRGEDSTYKEYGINIQNIFDTSRAIKDSLTSKGVEFQDGHVGLLMLIQVAGHEAGHMIQSGLARVDQASDLSHFSHVALEAQPDQATTAHAETNANIRDEQFAEGYGNLVMARAARDLGYDDTAIAALSTLLAPSEAQATTIALLPQVTATKGLKELAQEQGIAKPNVGEAGYSKPLSTEQVIRDLEIMESRLTGNPLESAPVAATPEAAVHVAEVRESKRKFFRNLFNRVGK